jgi:hypothetical protein
VKALVFQARESLASWRRARETPCIEIREQLATLRGAALKRATLRRHVARCEGCRQFEGEVRRQRAAMAALLPVIPTAGLKASVLGAAGVAAGAGSGASLAGLGGAAKGIAAKTMLCAAVAGGAGSAGYVAVHEVQMHDASGIIAATGSRHRHGIEHRAPKAAAAAAAKPIVAAPATAPAPVVVAAATTPRAASPHRSIAARDAHRGLGRRAWGRRHLRHRGRHGSANRGNFDARDGSAKRDGSANRDDSAKRRGFDARGGSTDRGGFAKRGGFADRSDSADRGDSAKRRGFGKHRDSAHPRRSEGGRRG